MQTSEVKSVTMQAVPELLMERRRQQLEDLIGQSRLFSRRARLPEDRIALGEIERELMQLKDRWLADGKISAQVELELNGAAER